MNKYCFQEYEVQFVELHEEKKRVQPQGNSKVLLANVGSFGSRYPRPNRGRQGKLGHFPSMLKVTKES